MNVVKVFSKSVGIGVARGVSLDLKIKILNLNLCCLFLPKKSKTLYSGHLVLADTFFRNRRCPLLTGLTVLTFCEWWCKIGCISEGFVINQKWSTHFLIATFSQMAVWFMGNLIYLCDMWKSRSYVSSSVSVSSIFKSQFLLNYHFSCHKNLSFENIQQSVNWYVSIFNIFLREFKRKNSNISPAHRFFSCFWRTAYQSALTPRNLCCLEKFLVARMKILKALQFLYFRGTSQGPSKKFPNNNWVYPFSHEMRRDVPRTS